MPTDTCCVTLVSDHVEDVISPQTSSLSRAAGTV